MGWSFFYETFIVPNQYNDQIIQCLIVFIMRAKQDEVYNILKQVTINVIFFKNTIEILFGQHLYDFSTVCKTGRGYFLQITSG